ncbi:MAG: restriction endonuclease subunit S [bacterium]|nr:restriction endonuclease subunit S [bacterium]
MTSPIDLNPRSLQTVERILADYVPHCEVRAYGSRARWEARDYSDLDLAVVGDGPLDRRIVGDLREAFEESDLPIRVDVVDWHAIDDAFRRRIEPDSVVMQHSCHQKGWPSVALGDVVNNFDSRRVPLSRRERATRPGPYPYYGATGVMDYIDNYLFEELHLLVGEDGSVETPTGTPYVQLVDGQFWVNNHAHVLQGSDDDETRFLYYALSASQIRPFVSGSVQAKLTQANLNRVPVPYPKHASDRRSIVGILGALDDKIELNTRMSETLDEMGRALFKSWFVDFDPVRAKAEGRPTGLPPEIDDLFPCAFESSELGTIPTGWDVKSLGDAFHITMGQSPPSETYNYAGDGIPFYQGRADFGFRFPSRRVYCTSPRRLADANDTLISVRAPVGDVNVATEPCCIGRGLAAIRHHGGHHSFTFYSMQALSRTFEPFESEGTVFGSLSKKGFRSLIWISPPQSLIAHFEANCSTLDSRIGSNAKASVALAALRDTLLPRLLSGELRVPTAEVA